MFEPYDTGSSHPDPARNRPKDHSSELTELRDDVERLYLITDALWRILRDRQGLDETEIVRQITEIDMEDGILSGRKAKSPAKPCPKCNRPIGRQRGKCIFCGEYIVSDPFAR